MKEDFDNLLKRKIDEKRFDDLGEEFKIIADKYSVCEKTVYNRFRSMYGKKAKDIIKEAIIPKQADLEQYLLLASSSEEFFELAKIPCSWRVGFYDRVFGCSTFKAARNQLLINTMRVDYNPLREDNRSLWYSQLLGDGHYNRKRHAFTITHGIKQLGYLKWKVALINKAYPKTPSKVSVLKHAQGHEYGSYYSGHIGNIDIPEDRSSVVSKMTPLGWLLWWLDDGGHYQDITIFTKDASIVSSAIDELRTYAISARPSQNGFTMRGEENNIKFYKNFVEPFKAHIPMCVQYKVKI